MYEYVKIPTGWRICWGPLPKTQENSSTSSQADEMQYARAKQEQTRKAADSQRISPPLRAA
jgi:hypothetical protein